MNGLLLKYFIDREALQPRFNPTHIGQAGVAGDGPFMRLEFLVHNGKIVASSFDTYNCPVAIACASLISKTSIGLLDQNLASLTYEDFQKLSQGVPAGKEHCIGLVVEAIHSAFSETRSTSSI